MASSSTKLSFIEFCQQFGIDVVNDPRNAFFWDLLSTAQVTLTEDLLDWCGYKGPRYQVKKNSFISLLKKNPHIEYTQVHDEENDEKEYLKMKTLDFESLLQQMLSPEACEIRQLWMSLKNVLMEYTKSEMDRAEAERQNVSVQNDRLNLMVAILKDQVQRMKVNADREIDRAEEELNRLENERAKAEQKHARAEQDLSKVSERNEKMKERIRSEVALPLQDEVSRHISPPPINRGKERCFGLIALQPREWYIVRCQQKSFNHAVKKKLETCQNARVVKKWRNVSHAVDVGNCLKQQLRDMHWCAEGNILQQGATGVEYTDEQLIAAVEKILHENVALEISNTTFEIIEN